MSNKKLQKVQNAAARITLRMSRTEHTTPLLRMLHWLPISNRIAYKIDSICHTSLTTAHPLLCSLTDTNIPNAATTRATHTVNKHLHTRDPAIVTESLVKFEGARTYIHVCLYDKLETSSISRNKISKTFYFIFILW